MARGSIKPLTDPAGKLRGYRLKFDLPPHPGTGARRQRNETIHRRPGETAKDLRTRADQRLAVALSDVGAGMTLPDRTATLADYLSGTWLPHHVTTVEPSSGEVYRWAVERWIVPRLGATRLANLRTMTIQHAYTEILAAGLSSASLHLIHATLTAALSQAVKWEILARSPCAGVDLAPVESEPARALTPLEVDDLLRAARKREDRFADLYELLVLTQLRIGEALGLHWEDVDLAVSVLRVTQTAKRRGRLGKPKTKGSRRIVWLGPRAREILAAQRIRQQERRELAGDRWTERGLVFDRGDGGLQNADVVRTWLKTSAELAGIGHVTPHMLRHTGITYMGREGVNPFVAGDRAGHDSVAQTRHYTHVTAEWQREPALAIERILAGARDTAVTRDENSVEKP